MLVEEFLKAGRGIAIDAMMGEESNFVLNPVGDRKLGKSMVDQHDVFMFWNSHKDPSSTVLDVLELLKSLARYPDDKYIAVVQPVEDRGMDEFLYQIG